MEKAHQYIGHLPESGKHGLDPLFDVWQSQREHERVAMIQHLESEAYKTFKSQFEAFLQKPNAGLDDDHKHSIGKIGTEKQIGIPNLVRYAVPLLIYTRLAAVNAYETVLPTATIMQLHELRIEFKQLRYTVEFFVEVLGEKAKLVIQDIKQVQDHLGDLNDAEVASLLLGDILNTWEDQHRQISIDERPDPLPLLNYLTYRVKERHDLIREFPIVWKQFTRPVFRKNLALAIAAL
jgi:CHAD domain-containing protein